MKKYASAPALRALAAAGLLFLAGCKSAGIDMRDYTPAAIMTVYANSSVPWYEEPAPSGSTYKVSQEEEGLITGAVNKLFTRKNPENTEKQERVDFAARILSEKLRECGIEVIDPSSYSSSSVYKNAGKNFFDTMNNQLPAEGYDAINSASSILNRRMSEETGAASLFYVKFMFQKEYVKEGLRNVGVAARVTMSVYGADSRSKTILNKEYVCTSTQFTGLKNSRYDSEALCSFFPETTIAVIEEFAEDCIPQEAVPETQGTEEDLTPVRLPSSERPAEESASPDGQD